MPAKPSTYSLNVGDEIIVSGNRALRVTAVEAFERITEFVDGPPYGVLEVDPVKSWTARSGAPPVRSDCARVARRRRRPRLAPATSRRTFRRLSWTFTAPRRRPSEVPIISRAFARAVNGGDAGERQSECLAAAAAISTHR
jgi:hypothetical protein